MPLILLMAILHLSIHYSVYVFVRVHCTQCTVFTHQQRYIELSQHSCFHSLYISFSMGVREVAFLNMSNTFALPPFFLQIVPVCENPLLISQFCRNGNGHNHLNSSFTSLESSGLGFNSPASRSDLQS